MNRSFRQFVLAIFSGLILYGAVTTAAHAGFLVAPMESEKHLQFDHSLSMESSTPAEKVKSPEHEARLDIQQDALFAGSNTGSMGSQSVSGSQAPAAPFALPATTAVVSPGQLELQLVLEANPLYTRCVKSRLFRPPRKQNRCFFSV